MSTTLNQAAVDFEGLIRVLGDNLYSTPEVAVRELVQNAHDSCTRRAVELEDGVEGRIVVETSAQEPLIRIVDNGCGLTDDEIRRYLATLGAGYTRVLREQSGRADLIGAFGLGFFSAYTVAERVVVTTRSAHAPEQVWRFTSRKGDRYTIEAVDEAHEIGTTVTLHLRREHRDLARPDRLRRLLERYCALLPVPVLCPTPVNEEPPPWRRDLSVYNPARQRRVQLDFAARFEHRFEPICALSAEEDGPLPGGARGLVWVQDGASYATSDTRRVVLFVRGMLITQDARELLPEWAGFMGAVLECDDLTPTASREDVQKDATFKALVGALRERIIDGLSKLPKREPEAWRRVLRRHNEALLGAALTDPRLFALLRDSLTVPTSEGDLTLPELQRRSGGRVLISTGEGNGYEEIVFRALSRPVVEGQRFAAMPFVKRFAEERGLGVVQLGTGKGDAEMFPSVEVGEGTQVLLQDLLGDADTRVVCTRFEPPSLPAVLVPDREAGLKRRLEDDATDKRISSGLLSLARVYTNQVDGRFLARLYVNLDAPIVARLMASAGPRQRHAASILRAVADLTCRARVEGMSSDVNARLGALSEALQALMSD
ncbi:MAG: ATP-binding protein [Alphaproteobacteria bacterium]|nr:ATP-binding protein [Alphaproteobacteria bacterium]MCB9792726.1 ATP-binding protein [Alphaproteobacteria bacterium]